MVLTFKPVVVMFVLIKDLGAACQLVDGVVDLLWHSSEDERKKASYMYLAKNITWGIELVHKNLKKVDIISRGVYSALLEDCRMRLRVLAEY